MNKYFIPRISSAIPHQLKGRAAAFTIDPKSFKEDPIKASEMVIDKYDEYLKHNNLDKSLKYNFPQFFRRLNERQSPSKVRRQLKEDQMRNTDKAIVNGFCNFFMWSQAAYKPQSKGKGRK